MKVPVPRTPIENAGAFFISSDAALAAQGKHVKRTD